MACEARGNARAGVVVAAWDTAEIVGGDGEHVLGQPLFAARQARMGESVGHRFRKVDLAVIFQLEHALHVTDSLDFENVQVDDQLSLTKGFFKGVGGDGGGIGAGHVLSNDSLARDPVSAGYGDGGGGQGDAERDLEEGSMELIYDPKLGVFFDPKTNAFFMREPVR